MVTVADHDMLVTLAFRFVSLKFIAVWYQALEDFMVENLLKDHKIYVRQMLGDQILQTFKAGFRSKFSMVVTICPKISNVESG